MLKYLLVLVFLILNIGMSFAQDNTKINILSKEVDNLKSENQILKEKIDILNSTNDKILNSVYWTMGAILTALIGLSVWNAIKSQRLNENIFDERLKSVKNDLLTTIPEQVQSMIIQKENIDIKKLNNQTQNINNSLINLQIQYLILLLKSHPYHNIYIDESNRLLELLRIVTRSENISSYEETLEALKNYLIKGIYLGLTDKSEILDMLENDFSSSSYRFIVDEIKKLMNKAN